MDLGIKREVVTYEIKKPVIKITKDEHDKLVKFVIECLKEIHKYKDDEIESLRKIKGELSIKSIILKTNWSHDIELEVIM